MTLNEAIHIIAREITAVLGENALSVYLYGSVALGDFKLGWSDIDILVLTKNEITVDHAETLTCPVLRVDGTLDYMANALKFCARTSGLSRTPVARCLSGVLRLAKQYLVSLALKYILRS